MIAELLRHFEIFLGIDALRRAVEFCKLLPGRVTVERLEGLELLPELLHLPDLRHVPVVVGVIADRMPLLRHAPNEVWISLDVVADQEECRRSMVLLQRIEDLRRAAVLIARVEREIDALLRRIAKEGRIILPQPVRRGVSHGRLALLLEAQAPRACRERRCLLGRARARKGQNDAQHEQDGQIPPVKVSHVHHLASAYAAAAGKYAGREFPGCQVFSLDKRTSVCYNTQGQGGQYHETGSLYHVPALRHLRRAADRKAANLF